MTAALFMDPAEAARGAAREKAGKADPTTIPELRGEEGKGYGFPLYELGRLAGALFPVEESPENFVEPLDLAAKIEIARSQCGEWNFDSSDESNDDPEYREKHMGLEKWLQSSKEAYEQLKKENGTENGPRNLNIFLPNNMRTMNTVDMDTYPARTVGRLVSVVGTCSATIIQSDLVLTNRHCLGITAANTLPANFWTDTYMQVGLTSGVYNYKAYFGRVRWSATSKDYAILQLLEPLGLYTGWPGIKFHSLSHFVVNTEQISYIGYSGVLGGNAGGDFTCRTRNGLLDWDDVHHDCDATRGSSGSALMTGLNYPIATSGAPYIVALNYGEYRDGGSVSLTLPSYSRSHRNVAKAASVFKDDFYTAKDWAPFPTRAPTRFPTPKPTPKPTATRRPTARPTLRPTKKLILAPSPLFIKPKPIMPIG
jgi:V8-like Glu-specific endopeptidase